MIRRVQTVSRRSLWLAVVPAAVALTACGGSGGHEAVTSAPVAASALPAPDEGTVSQSETTKVAVCHKGENKMVPHGAVADHIGHGDLLGECVVTCPCFSVEQIEETWGDCPPENLFVGCSLGDLAFLLLNCPVGGTVPDGPTTYISDIAEGVCKVVPDGLESPVDAAEHEACVYVMESTGYCS